MTTDLKKEIVEYCKEVNEKCELEYDNFTFRNLFKRQWYLNVLQTLFPHLEENLQPIKKIGEETEAIDKLITQINNLDQFDRIQIDAKKVVAGDVNQINNLVQIILALFEIAMEDYEEEQYQINNQDQFKNINLNNKKNNLNLQKDEKILSQQNKPRSVQAIVNQFDKSEQEEGISHKNQQEQQYLSNIHKLNEYQTKKNYDPFKKNSDKNKINSQSKSSQRLQNVITIAKKNNKIKKNNNAQGQKIIEAVGSKKKLVTHPKSPETLKKAKSTDAIALTKKVQQDLKKTKKKQKTDLSSIRATSPMQQQMTRKKKQLDYKINQTEKQKVQNKIVKSLKRDYSQKNQKNLQKLLNWRQAQVKKQRKQYEQSLRTKVMDKKQQYIRKINKLILQLERQKQIQQKKQFKQNLIRDNEQAVKRLTRLEQWYKNKLNILNEKRKQKNQKRILIKTGHKQMIGRIEKYLKKENEEKLMRMTNKYRAETNNIETDFEELRDKIIKVYQKN